MSGDSRSSSYQMKLMMPITLSMINFWQYMKSSIYPAQKNISIQHIRCCMEYVRKSKNCFLISLLKSQVWYSWQKSTMVLLKVREISYELEYAAEDFPPYQRQNLLWSQSWECPPIADNEAMEENIWSKNNPSKIGSIKANVCSVHMNSAQK